MLDKEYFTQIKNELIRSEKLTLQEKCVLFVILSYGSLGKIYLSQSRIARESGMSRNTVSRVIKSLKKSKYIQTKELPDRSTLEYTLLCRVVTPKNDTPAPENDRGCTCVIQGVAPEDDTSNINMSDINIEIKKPTKKKSTKKNAALALAIRVLDYFNKINKKNGRPITLVGKTKTTILARIRQGYGEEQLNQITEVTYNKWHDDPNMRQYLHPTVIWNSDIDKRLLWERSEESFDCKSYYDKRIKEIKEAGE